MPPAPPQPTPRPRTPTHLEPLADRLDVVVGAPLVAPQQPPLHDLAHGCRVGGGGERAGAQLLAGRPAAHSSRPRNSLPARPPGAAVLCCAVLAQPSAAHLLRAVEEEDQLRLDAGLQSSVGGRMGACTGGWWVGPGCSSTAAAAPGTNQAAPAHQTAPHPSPTTHPKTQPHLQAYSPKASALLTHRHTPAPQRRPGSPRCAGSRRSGSGAAQTRPSRAAAG